MKKSPCTIIAALLWSVALIALLVRAGLHPGRPTSLTTYLAGGSAWNGSLPVYLNWRGFVYPPFVAWIFSMLARLPLALAAVLWRLVTAGGFLLGLGALLRSGVFHRIPAQRHGLVFIGALPLSIGNLDNAQANPLIAGLMMLAVAAMQWESWTLCAAAAAVATMFKIYPVALALLLCLLRPGKLTWRFALILALLALLPFAVKDAHYVSSQYHAWLQSRLSDDRFHYTMKDAPLDLWYLLVRLCNLPVSPRVYTILQIVSGGAIAVFVWIRSRAGTPLPDILATLFLLVSGWMLLLGPATENQTYVVLAPAAALLAIDCISRPNSAAARILGCAAYALLLVAVARNSFAPHIKDPWSMAIQPIAALLFVPAVLMVTPSPPR